MEQRRVREFFRGLRSPLVLDGGMGTQLAERGWHPPMLPEEMCLHMPQAVLEVHRGYVASGAAVIETNSFGGSVRKLSLKGLGDRAEELARRSAELARRAAGDQVLVAGSVGPSGDMLKPLGDMSFQEAVMSFEPQVRGLVEGGADLILVETMLDLKEAKAAVEAVKRVREDMPFVVSFTFDRDGRTVSGDSPEAAAIWAEAVGAIGVGANCGLGPRGYVEVVRRLAGAASLPVWVYPNAGVPSAGDYLGPQEFAEGCAALLEAGASVIGGCCGTTPEHVKALAAMAANRSLAATDAAGGLRLCGRSKVFSFGPGLPLGIIGERINVSRKSPIREQVGLYRYGAVKEEARSQALAGASVIDVNVGLPEIDQVRAMREAVWAVESAAPLPISLDSDDLGVLEAGLREAAGVPLINSVTAKEEQLRLGMRLAMRYGAALTVLLIDHRGILEDGLERARIAERVLEAAREEGFPGSRIVFDPLTLTLGSGEANGLETLRAVREVVALGGLTSLGISNVSHGLPARGLLNRSFLAMAMGAGLDMVICNPLDRELMGIVKACDALRGRDKGLSCFMAFGADWCDVPSGGALGALKAKQPEGGAVGGSKAPDGEVHLSPLAAKVLDGDEEGALGEARRLIDLEGPLGVISDHLVPALDEVGRRYETGEFFLPQLIEAAQAASAVCALAEEELLREGSSASRGTVVLATVEGDLHDLGKNVVATVLKSHGYRVVDLGKDVKAERIVEAALREGAQVVGLSALMTSTVPRMKEVIEETHRRGCGFKVIVGGAAVSPWYARSIGADGMSYDAVGAC
ncbi:Homocysteine S-methyltransferase [Thermanaerovibrio velox DSM 12556]|uniref:Methionine synthase n=1 Tax=Thermanaerovibrio velox DSM 12556 TaxID=926567 RepID=H0UR06_9BACT|nr:homocysteine S-methyltransferase family protein [Thermanaerovibrio velox]EHM10843.1 Homocysteine S-methyltransferase [Thermanaerovibrio velox DSM 12556]